ncbi:hypothetical protein MuYL_3602 [Mucilaginibacter xinganensis]|uniref:Uncharacterized protein n=1 Tax=Mucilaginibacter xinganensis TaxID=1234841 RepID=A0A223P054_9SPHI|nr:hypothetical protein MuYL_3602 [Mucilaginibacter xinganensis]
MRIVIQQRLRVSVLGGDKFELQRRRRTSACSNMPSVPGILPGCQYKVLAINSKSSAKINFT